MAGNVIQPRPGSWNGIEFRSQLEIKWAQWFHSHTKEGWAIEYMDEHDFDFLLTCTRSDIGWHTIEIKPRVYSVCANAIKRLDFNARKPGDRWSLIVGNPPSPYGRPLILQFQFCTASDLYGPHPELSAYVTHSILYLDDDCRVPPLIPLNTHYFNTCLITVGLWDEYAGGDESDMPLVDDMMVEFARNWED